MSIQNRQLENQLSDYKTEYSNAKTAFDAQLKVSANEGLILSTDRKAYIAFLTQCLENQSPEDAAFYLESFRKSSEVITKFSDDNPADTEEGKAHRAFIKAKLALMIVFLRAASEGAKLPPDIPEDLSM
ncbi:hypothetical protein JNK13_07655 [bacterium]|nr:hypothetical protein [bacterium]